MLREAGQRPCLRQQPLTALDRVRRVKEAGHLVERVDRDDLRVEDLLDLVAHRVVDRLLVELTRDRLLHAVDQRQLRVPLPRLVHQPRVLQRHAQTARQRLQQLLVRLAERALAVHVLQRDEAGHRAADEERHHQRRQRLLIRHEWEALSLPHSRKVVVEQERLPTLDHEPHEPEAVQRVRLPRRALAAFDRVREVQQVRRALVCADVDGLRVEDLLDLVADRVVDRLLVELTRDRLLHAVDQRQLRVPLPRLVHQPRVLQRHAQTAGQRLQQLPVRLAERVLAIDVLQRDHAGRPAGRDEWHEQDRFRLLADVDQAPVALRRREDVLGDQDRFQGLQHVFREADG